MSAEEEAGTVGILRAWDRAPDGVGGEMMHSRVLAALTDILEREGLAAHGCLTQKALDLCERVNERTKKAREKRVKKSDGEAPAVLPEPAPSSPLAQALDLLRRTRPVPPRAPLTEEEARIARGLHACAGAWEPDVRLIGNLTAREIERFASAILSRGDIPPDVGPPHTHPLSPEDEARGFVPVWTDDKPNMMIAPSGSDGAPAHIAPRTPIELASIRTDVDRVEAAIATMAVQIERLDAEMRHVLVALARRPKAGAPVEVTGGWCVYDDRGVLVASWSPASGGDWTWTASRPHKVGAHGRTKTESDARAAALAVLRTWADVEGHEGKLSEKAGGLPDARARLHEGDPASTVAVNVMPSIEP